MCALRPGVPGLSEHIRVRSIIGRFLEHSRIFWFANGAPDDGGQSEVFCGSADWMTRNLYERCEVVFPVVDAALKRRLREEILDSYLHDNLKARLMNPDGSYERAPKSVPALSAQQSLMEISRTPDKQYSRDKSAAPESTPAEDAESILSKEQSGL
jgi:polyphosphate kinase